MNVNVSLTVDGSLVRGKGNDTMATRSPTLHDVAAVAGVSHQTVSNVINAPERVAAGTLDRVRGAIDATGYVPNRSARSLRTRTSGLLALRMETAAQGNVGPFRDRFLGALTVAAGASGHDVLLFARGEDDDDVAGYEELLRSTTIDAFVLLDSRADDPRLSALDDLGAAYVAFGRPWGNDSATHPWVDVDGAAGTNLATRHLIDNGWPDVAFLGWPEDSDTGQDRLAGCQAALAEAGLGPDGLAVARSIDTFEAAAAAAGELLDAGHTAIVCASDTLAGGVYRAAFQRGLRVGVDVAVAGFDDSSLASVLAPGLTSVHQPLEQVAQFIIDALTRVLDDHPAPVSTTLAPRLVTRGSTAPRPNPSQG